MAKGIIYLMTTIVDGLVKIGKSNSNGFDQRMYNLEHNGYCNVTGLKREFAIEVDDYDEKEKMLHTIFSKSRVADTELFSVDLNLVKQLLSSFDGTMIYPKNETKNDVFDDASQKWQVKWQQKASKLTFAMLGIPQGSELVYTKDPNIKVNTVDDGSRVEYQGEQYTLSGFVKHLKNGGSWQGGMFFTYNGEKLTDIRERKGL